MSVFGVVCEVNPLHGGHKLLLERARNMGAECVVCVMSGNTVQRGEFAVADRYTRAQTLIDCGADLVLELPFPWSASSAESFARGAISILRHFCDTVIFGSEQGGIESLCAAATLASSPEFRQAYEVALSEGEPAAAAYVRLLRESGVKALGSNDLLGIEYIRATRFFDFPMRFLTVKREGAAYTEELLGAEGIPSATAIRRAWAQGDFAQGLAYLPEASAAVYKREREKGTLTVPDSLDRILLTYFRMVDEEHLCQVVGRDEGLLRRICAMARRATSAEELMALCRTKRYTDAHLRRLILFALAQVSPDDVEKMPSYTTLLAANDQGRALLGQQRKKDTLCVVTKPADAPTDTRQFVLGDRIDRIFSLLSAQPRSAEYLLRARPYMK